jgi:ABC-type uncharacterized transport system involved in gliding motility auxiliary subunit
MSNRFVSPDQNRPVLLDRLAVARISSGIGGLALVVAVLALLLQRDITPLALISTVIGIVGIVVWTVLAPNDFRNLITGRQAFYGGNSIFTSILLFGIVAIVYALTANSGVFADLTGVRYYSLKPDVRATMLNLRTPIQITAFYDRTRLGDQAMDTPILRMFADVAPNRVRLVFADPDEQPLLAKSFGLVGSFGIFVSELNSQGAPDLQRTVQMQGAFARESWIAEAILQLQAQGKYKVVFTVGHGEIGTDITLKEDAYGIRAGMEKVGILTGTVDLRSESIPAGTTALVLLRPQADLAQSEVDKIAEYVRNGGHLLVMAKPAYIGSIQFMTTADGPMAKYLWDTWGLRPQNDIVFDPKSYVDNPYRLLAAYVVPHKITNRDETGTVVIRPLFTIAQSWQVAQPPPNNVEITTLFTSSDQSIGKVNLIKVASNPDNPDNLRAEAGDLKGPLVLMAAATNTLTNAKLVVIGDSDWAYNDTVTTYDGQYLWTNTIDWLTQYLTNITVNPVVKQLPLIADQASLNLVAVITLAILPGLVLLTGGFVWWSRLRRQ